MFTRILPTSIVSIAIVTFLQGCSVTLQNHTPAAFPWQGWRDFPDSTLYSNTGSELGALAARPAHRFLLEVKPKNVSNVRAYVTVNNVQYPMSGSGRGLWTYESTNECQEEYSYYYRVRYNAGLYGNKAKLLGSEQEPFNVGVTAGGQECWIVPVDDSLTAVHTGDGSISILPFDAKDIIIQNLAPYPVRIIQLWFHTRPGESNDNSKFELRDLPTLPHDLLCGESLKVQVFWRTQPPDYSDKGLILLNMTKDPVGTGNYSQGFRAYIELRGYFVP